MHVYKGKGQAVIHLITDKLAERRAHREKKERERQEAIEQERIARETRHLTHISNTVLARHMSQCCVSRKPFHINLDMEGAKVQVSSKLMQKSRKKVTVIKVTDQSAGLKLLAVYSDKPRCIGQRVCPI